MKLLLIIMLGIQLNFKLYSFQHNYAQYCVSRIDYFFIIENSVKMFTLASERRAKILQKCGY